MVSIQNRLLGLNPDTGKELWNAEGVHRYVCPSVVADEGIVYAIGGGHTSLAVKAGGRGDVTKTHVVWRQTKGSNVPSPIYHEGHLYWASDNGGSGELPGGRDRQGRVPGTARPELRAFFTPRRCWPTASSITSRRRRAPTWWRPNRSSSCWRTTSSQDDSSRTNASVAVSNGQLLLRSDQYLYCIGNR